MQLTAAYETKVALTKATRDPRLLRGNFNNILDHKNSYKSYPRYYTYLISTYRYTYLTFPCFPAPASDFEVVPQGPDRQVLLPTHPVLISPPIGMPRC